MLPKKMISRKTKSRGLLPAPFEEKYCLWLDLNNHDEPGGQDSMIQASANKVRRQLRGGRLEPFYAPCCWFHP